MDEFYYDLHWIIIRFEEISNGFRRSLKLPIWYEAYYDFFHLNNEFDRWGLHWSKIHKKTFNAHCLICSLH